ncbi:hypothetical protein GQS52_26825 [Streptomyces sp. SCUT-3]|uniref:hypothetical protein n=1 Tax=Streptomyces sp. SCUT-3 TaxID=2684469 RepID=UPI0015F85990|nr:hypothetical protein [Streptomyces sp. SCUT-3]QMV20470.1 hypothetical protein GQS52_00035 [Streptomyces sp. SCUT-3]QMV24772.1 hypothetical protein GQS52_26825 [Streptomyces sp. SCUT-3]
MAQEQIKAALRGKALDRRRGPAPCTRAERARRREADERAATEQRARALAALEAMADTASDTAAVLLALAADRPGAVR